MRYQINYADGTSEVVEADDVKIREMEGVLFYEFRTYPKDQDFEDTVGLVRESLVRSVLACAAPEGHPLTPGFVGVSEDEAARRLGLSTHV